MTQSLFDKYGGIALMQRLVEAFHARLLTEPELAHLCGGQNWKSMVRHEVCFLTRILGGPEISAQPLQGLSNRHFDLLVMHLMLALESAGVETADRIKLMRRVSGLRVELVSGDPESLISKGMQRYQDLMERAAAELERATRELSGVKKLLLNQQRLKELVGSLAAAQDRLSEHDDLCHMIGELRSMV
ncbi:MAG: hypothetical protein ACAI44_06205 [Candidatus Sericytochromatia bacterium]